MSGIFTLLRTLWRARVGAFWPIWIATTVVAVLWLGWSLCRHRVSSIEPVAPARPRPRSRLVTSVAAILLLVIVLGSAAVRSFWGEHFTDYDNSMFTLYTLEGKNLDPPIWRENGRFFPLGHQEWDIIRHFTHTPRGYHVFPLFELLTVCLLLLFVDEQLTVAVRSMLAAFLVVTPGMVVSYGGLTYPERNLILALVLLLLFVKRFERTHSVAWAMAAAACAQVMLYYKEPAFLLLITFALTRLALRCRMHDGAGWDLEGLKRPEGRLDVCFLVLGGLFFLFYMAEMLPHPNIKYARDAQLPEMAVIVDYFKLDWLPWLLTVFSAWRAYQIVRGKTVADSLWDPLAFGGVAYFCAYPILRIYSAYYLTPVDVIAVLCLGRFAYLGWSRFQPAVKVAVAFVTVMVVCQGVALSTFRVFERKNTIDAKREVANIVVREYTNSGDAAIRVYLPFSSPDRVMEFASYLKYRGVKVEGVDSDTSQAHDVRLVAQTVPADGRCVPWEVVVCRRGRTPRSGDLVVILPDDNVSFAEVKPFIDSTDPFLSYEPRPHIPPSVFAAVRHLHVVSPAFSHLPLPDHWLNASIGRWR